MRRSRQDVSLTGVFSDTGGDSPTITAASSDDAVVSAFAFSGTLTIATVIKSWFAAAPQRGRAAPVREGDAIAAKAQPPGTGHQKMVGGAFMAWEDDGLEPGESPEDRREFRRMMDALGREDILRMIEQLSGEVGADPPGHSTLVHPGLLYNELGEHRHAAGGYGRIIDPANPYYGRARAKSELGEPLRAVGDLGRTIELEPANVEARRHWAMVYRHMGETDKAVEDHDELRRRFPATRPL